MLKKYRGLVLGLLVLVGSAYVTPTYASSASSVVLRYIQAAGPIGATEEVIVIYNNSPDEVDITGWCLQNKSPVKFACFTPNQATLRLYLPAYSSAVIASNAVVQAQLYPQQFTWIYPPTHQGNGSIIASSDTISLLDAENNEVDRHAWVSPGLSSGTAWYRNFDPEFYWIYDDTNQPSDWDDYGYMMTPPNPQHEYREMIEEYPEEPVEDPPVTYEHTLRITEIFPNPSGTDTGNEFIELYNSSTTHEVILDDYQLFHGVDLDKVIQLPAGLSVPPLSYIVISNADVSFSLTNTAGQVELRHKDGTVVDTTNPYVSAKDGHTWALVEGVWQYMSNPTPGAENSIIDDKDEPTEEAGESQLKPCADNQYRHPETNRCRLIETASTQPQPCKEGQERNPETGRCRNIVTTSSPTPCPEGQERNLETNRCRTIKKMTTTEHGVQGVATVQSGGPQWYIWGIVVVGVLAVVGYAAWEWRTELLSLLGRIRAKFKIQRK